MRQIKFRGYSEKYKSWHYGCLDIKADDKCFIKSLNKNGTASRARVDEESVGQFTEMFDCNGKPIYEGDLVKDTSYEDEQGDLVVTMIDGSWSLMDEQGNYGRVYDLLEVLEVVDTDYEC